MLVFYLIRVVRSVQRIDFILPGVQKCATTALDFMMRGHSKIQMPSIKETHFFNNDALEWQTPSYQKYHSYFNWTSCNVLRGEVTPAYIYWPGSLERIKNYNPAIKLIVALRHPVFRAFSHWKMETARGHERLPFGQAIRSGRTRALGPHLIYSYVERGFYAGQIERVLSLFPRKNVHFLTADALWRDPTGEMAGVMACLGLEPFPTVERRYIVPFKTTYRGTLDEADRLYLQALYEDDLHRSALLTGLDLSAWLDPAYRDPMVETYATT